MRKKDESNIQYRFSSAEKLLADKDIIVKMIRHHNQHQVPRLEKLRSYYKGKNTKILEQQRRKEEHLADNRATHNFAKYVSQFIQGYMMGVPLKTTHENEAINEQLREINVTSEADEHNSDLVLDQSIYGRAYEMLYRGKDDKVKFINLDVTQSFVVYDETVECKPIAGIRYIKRHYQDYVTVYVYTHDKEYEYSLSDSDELELTEDKAHFFKGVPIIEYENDKYRMGDFEDVITLIDLYDASQSDTANYMQDLNDAMLKIVGDLDIDIDKAKAMKEANLLFLETKAGINGTTSNADADYIYKKYDVNGMEAYKDRLFNNILLFTSIPNLLDEEGTTAQSGEALKMKLFALSQKRATKERLFKKSLRTRYKLIDNILTIASEGGFDVEDITITFTENLPSMIDKELEWFSKMGGKLSQETLLSLLSVVENVQVELDRLEKEQEDVDYPFAEVSEDEEVSKVSEEDAEVLER